MPRRATLAERGQLRARDWNKNADDGSAKQRQLLARESRAEVLITLVTALISFLAPKIRCSF